MTTLNGKTNCTFASLNSYISAQWGKPFFFSHLDRVWQITLTSWRRKMYLTAPVYFKLFQTWGEARPLLRLNVNIVLLPSLMKYILQVLISFLFFWIERVFYEGRYIKDLMHAKRKVNSFAPNLRRDQRHVAENSNTRDRYRCRERKGRKKAILFIHCILS